MNDPLNGRRLCVRRTENADYEMWRTTDSTLAPIALDPYVDAFANTLSDALAEVAELYNVNGALCWLTNGKLARVNLQILPQIISQHIATKELENTGTETTPNWAVRYTPFVADQKTLRLLFTADKRTGSLIARVTKV